MCCLFSNGLWYARQVSDRGIREFFRHMIAAVEVLPDDRPLTRASRRAAEEPAPVEDASDAAVLASAVGEEAAASREERNKSNRHTS